MKKRILSVLLALVMVLGLLPATVFAAELTEDQKAELIEMGYSEADLENVMVVDADTVIDEAFDGLVIVVAQGVTVTVKGVALSTGVVVLPTAPEAKVVLEANSNANAVILMGEKSQVIVDAEAKADFVTVAAPEAKADVAGAAGTVTVNEAAEKAEVKVAKADTVTNNAPEAKLDVTEAATVTNTAAKAEVKVAKADTVTNAGAEAKVEVTEAAAVSNTAEKADVKVEKADTVTNTGADTKVDVKEAAAVENTGANAEVKVEKAETVSNSGEGAKVDVAEAAAVTNTGANAEIKADKVDTVTNDGEGAKIEAPEGTVTDNTGTAEVTTPSAPVVDVPSTPSTSSGLGKIDVAPLGTEENRPYKTYSASQTTSSVKEVKASAGSDDKIALDAAYDVAITVTELEKNTAGGSSDYYVGIAIPKREVTGKTVSYEYFAVNVSGDTYIKAAKATVTEDGYYYFSISDPGIRSILVVETVTEKATTPDTPDQGDGDVQALDDGASTEPTTTPGTGNENSGGDGGDDTTTTDPVPEIFNYLINVTVADGSSKKEVGEDKAVPVDKTTPGAGEGGADKVDKNKTGIVTSKDTTITELKEGEWDTENKKTTTEYTLVGEDDATVTSKDFKDIADKYAELNKKTGDGDTAKGDDSTIALPEANPAPSGD